MSAMQPETQTNLDANTCVHVNGYLEIVNGYRGKPTIVSFWDNNIKHIAYSCYNNALVQCQGQDI